PYPLLPFLPTPPPPSPPFPYTTLFRSPGGAGGDDHVLLPAPGRSDPRADRTRRHRPGRTARRAGQDPLDALVSRDPQHQGRVRYGPRARGSVRAASRGAQPERRRGRAEPGRALAAAAGDAQPPDPHAASDARVQIGAAP